MDDILETTSHNGLEVQSFASFDDMALNENLLRGIYSTGFERPSPAQQTSIVAIHQGQDVFLHARSGTGKTAATIIGMLQRIDVSSLAIQAIVLCPVRELAFGLTRLTENLGEFLNVRVCCVLGGVSIREQIQNLQNGCHVLCATPGRLCDLIQRHVIDLTTVRIIVLDDFDRSFDMGFGEQIREIITALPENTQKVISTTVTNAELSAFRDNFLHNPIQIYSRLNQFPHLLDTLFYYVNIGAGESTDIGVEVIKDLQSVLTDGRALCFCNTSRKARLVLERLSANQISACCIFPEMTQQERLQVIQDFHVGGSCHILVSSDSNARYVGLVSASVVIHFDVPHNLDAFYQRHALAGRNPGGRMAVICFVSEDEDMDRIKRIESLYSIRIHELPADCDIKTMADWPVLEEERSGWDDARCIFKFQFTD